MEIVLQAWFYGTPIFYALYHARDIILTKAGPLFWWIYLSNPLSTIVVAYRRLVLAGRLSETPEIADVKLLILLAATLAGAIVLHFICYAVFKHYKPRFADEL
jgi:ABC-type polysaccharide/polyol phosphate export permease